VTGKASLIPAAALNDETVPVKKVISEPPEKPKSAKEQMREIGDLNRAVNRFAFLTCVCGLKIKVPPDFTKSNIVCPRCWNRLENPFSKTQSKTTLNP